MSLIIRFLFVIPLFILFRPCTYAHGPIVFFNKQILSKYDAIQFREDRNATVARVIVKEVAGVPEYYVVIQRYSLTELLRDTGKKYINMIFTNAPLRGWFDFHKNVRGFENRIMLQFPVAKANANWALIKPSSDTQLNGYNFLIMAFAEEEDDVAAYTESMILEMTKAFETKVSIKHQWLRLNAYHLKNIQDFHVEQKMFVNLRDQVIVYQNNSKAGVTREDVLERMLGFDEEKIIWENVETGLTSQMSSNTPSYESTTSGITNGGNSSVALMVMFTLLALLRK